MNKILLKGVHNLIFRNPRPSNPTIFQFHCYHNLPNLHSLVHTDGSHTDSGSGAGYIITTNNNNTTLEVEERSFKLPDYCTVYQTELTAIIEACKYLSTYTNTHIIIWSDSLSSIQARYLLAFNAE